MRVYDLRQKEVINKKDGCSFGFIKDVDISNEGEITHIIIDGPGRVFGVFGRDNEYRIPWDNVLIMDGDIVLVDVFVEDVLCEV